MIGKNREKALCGLDLYSSYPYLSMAAYFQPVHHSARVVPRIEG